MGNFENCKISNKPYFRFWLQPRLKIHNPKCIHKILGQELTLQLYNKLTGCFYTLLFNKCHDIFICIFCNKTNYLHLIYKCGSNMMPNKLKSQLICSCIKICHPMKSYVLMSKIDQRMKISIVANSKCMMHMHCASKILDPK